MTPEDPESSDGPPPKAGVATARPFESAPRDLQAGRGCSRMGLAGCGLVALVLGLAFLTMILKATDLVAWSLTRIRAEVERTLPADLPPAEDERLDAAFDAALARIESGDLDPIAFQALQAELLRFARRGTAPSVEEVRSLTEALEAFAGSTEGQPPAAQNGPSQVAGGVP